MFKRNGYYYLTTAEGGTAYDHAVTLARSRDIWGPYEDHPDLFVMSTKDVPLAQSAIQRTGHGQYVETPDGQVYHTFLMGRPITGPDGTGMYCPLGRETGIERCVWKDDWLYLEAGGLVPRAQVEGLADVAPRAPKDVVTEFAGQTLPSDFQWLRHPHPERLFRVDNGLHVIGRESFGSWFENALVARRQEHHVCTVETTVAFDPVSYQQSAGLTHYYNRFKFHKLLVSLEPDVGRCLRIVSCLGDYPDAALTWTPDMVPLADGPVELRAQIDNAALQFAWRQGGDWINIGPVLDASLISDEGGRGAHGSFTGAFLGMYVMDMTGQGREALFSRFAYLPKGA